MSDGTRLRTGMSLDRRKLRWILGIFLFALVIPTAVLIYQAYGQLEWEAFYQHRVLAEEFADRIDVRLRGIIATEEARSVTDYGFLIVQGQPSANFIQRSPLANLPTGDAIPGLMAYFQIDSHGMFSTPLLPVGIDASAYGLSTDDVAQRQRLERQVHTLLVAADAGSAPAPAKAKANAMEERDVASEPKRVDANKASQDVFDRLAAAPAYDAKSEPAAAGTGALGKIADLKLDSRYAAQSKDRPLANVELPLLTAERGGRKEQSIVAPEQAAAATGGRVGIFESELDPFVFRRLDAGHFVLFRKAWLNDQRLIQGAVIAQDKFVEGIVAAPFRETALARTSELIVGYHGQVVETILGQQKMNYSDRATAAMAGELLFRTVLSVPLQDFELIFSVSGLPVGPGGRVIGWATLVLTLVLCGGFWVVYRFGIRQIELSIQQQDFVSAVSHELKTPLTSIRMYGEILRAGWADEEKKRSYYDFIYHESERLSRLINNVLRLARLTRNGEHLDQRPIKVTELLSLVESKVAAQVEQAGFLLRIDKTAADDTTVRVDADSVMQILINLVDNAVKFSARADSKVVELGCRTSRNDAQFWVRDYGPGIPKGQMKKIFQLFYRAEGELTRKTVGTGIGLALVQELTSAMGGNVRVRNCEPGVEFTVAFPAAD
jgi:signal transduction histidine kinase